MTAAEKTRSEFEGCLSVREGQLNINMASRNLDDAGVERWCDWANECLADFVKIKRLPRREADGFLLCKEANFSSNAIGDMGGRNLLRVLFTHKIAVRIVKLFKNNLGRAFASSMMDWLTHTPVPVIELHLSHNYIPREGAVDILKAVGHNKVYPARNGNGSQQPLWLRLEQNIIDKANELLPVAEEQLTKIRGGKRGALLSLDNVPKSVPADAPCPLAQVAYLINQRDHRFRIPAESQQWKATAGPREANRWRISLTPEQAELAAKDAKAPSVSLIRSKTAPEAKIRADSGPEALVERGPERDGPVWNGLPVAEQLAAKKEQQATQEPSRGEESHALVPLVPVEDSDSENSDEAPGPIRRAPKVAVLRKAPPVANEGHGEAAVQPSAPRVKAPPPAALALPGGALGPPPAAPPPKPPPAAGRAMDVPTQNGHVEDAQKSSYFNEALLFPLAGLGPLEGFGPLGASGPASGPLHANTVGPPPGLDAEVDPKDTGPEVPKDFTGSDDIGFSERQRASRQPALVESDEEVQSFGQMVQDPFPRANGVHRVNNRCDEVDFVLQAKHGDPFKRAKELDFRTDLYRIKEAYMQLGREEFLRRVLPPAWNGGLS